MEISQALQNAHSLDKVVAIVNDGGTSHFDQNEIAAQYAYNATEGDGLSKANIEAHLDILVEAGAEFDFLKAVELATSTFVKTRQEIIDDILKSGAKYVKTTVSNESCATAIAIRDIENIDDLPSDFEWEECSIGLDEDDY